jgi:hypothetical protein
MQNASAQVSGAPAFGHPRVGQRVNTAYGAGKVVGGERYSRIDGGINRFAVELDGNPFFYSPSISGHPRSGSRTETRHNMPLIKGQRHQGNKPPF